MREKRINQVVIIALVLLCVMQVFIGRAEAKTCEDTKFYLIGMGPGDADLITIRGMTIIKKADVIVCPSNRLRENFASLLKDKEIAEVSHELWRSYGKDCSELKGSELKECEKNHEQLQEFIKKLRTAVKKGKTVAVLDSGDPFIYGPWNWVIEEFADLNPLAIPGVSAFNAANAALQKDVCRGKNAHSVILTSRWGIEKLGNQQATMVVFTMRSEFEDLIKKLLTNHSPDTPIAIVVHAGYMEKERVVNATLGTIMEKIGGEKLPFEYIIYVGDFLTYQRKT